MWAERHCIEHLQAKRLPKLALECTQLVVCGTLLVWILLQGLKRLEQEGLRWCLMKCAVPLRCASLHGPVDLGWSTKDD